MADRDPVLGEEHGAHLERPTPPSLAELVEAPGPVHPQVRVHGEAAIRAQQEMLAARSDRQDALPRKVGCREARHA